MTDHETVLEIYRDIPLENGDVVLLTNHQVVQEIEGLADNWDPLICRNIAWILTELEATEVRLAIARPEAELLPQDHALWADLREELLSSPMLLHPPVALPAAA